METPKDVFGPIMHMLDIKSQDVRKAAEAQRGLQAWLDVTPFLVDGMDAETGFEREAAMGAVCKERAFSLCAPRDGRRRGLFAKKKDIGAKA